MREHARRVERTLDAIAHVGVRRVRDEQDRLICQHKDRDGKRCGAKIGGLTGLDELNRLARHYRERHSIRLSNGEALHLRAEWGG